MRRLMKRKKEVSQVHVFNGLLECDIRDEFEFSKLISCNTCIYVYKRTLK